MWMNLIEALKGVWQLGAATAVMNLSPL